MTVGQISSSSRRNFLRLGGGAAIGGALAGPHAVSFASSGGVHRALVCVYQFGDNRNGNLVAPLDPDLKDKRPRSDGPQALSPDAVAPLPFGSHPSLVNLHELYESRVLALVEAGNFRTGLDAYRGLRFLPNGFATLRWAADMAGVRGWDGDGAYTFQSGFSLVAPGARTFEGGQFENATLLKAIAGAQGLATRFPATPIGVQLEEVAKLVAAGPPLGMDRQVFVCAMSGFGAAGERHAALLGQLSEAMAAFYRATVELGIANRVTTYTDSEGAATQRMVLGGAVLGGETYGRSSGRGNAPETKGILAPAITSDEYAATLAAWFGVGLSELPNFFEGFGGSTLRFMA